MGLSDRVEVAEMSNLNTPPMEEHPDVARVRRQHDRVMEEHGLGMQARVAQGVEGFVLMTGIYIAISPWSIGFNGQSTILVNDLVVGLTVALLAMGFATASGRTHAIAWVVPVLGVWVIIAPWVVSGVNATGPVILSNVIAGAVAVVLGLSALGASSMPKRSPR